MINLLRNSLGGAAWSGQSYVHISRAFVRLPFYVCHKYTRVLRYQQMILINAEVDTFS